MNINIFGSTGNIGTKTLSIIKSKFPFIQINLLLLPFYLFVICFAVFMFLMIYVGVVEF